MKWLVQMEIRQQATKKDRRVDQVRRSSMLGRWMRTKLNSRKVVYLSGDQSEEDSSCRVDVAFQVGGATKIDYLVLQVHYANIDKFTGKIRERNVTTRREYPSIISAGETDRSGLLLTTSSTPSVHLDCSTDPSDLYF